MDHRVPGVGARQGRGRLLARPSSPAWRPGVVALYQKCVHLGCRVPQCDTSQWFECPCHGSQYNQVGEKKGGPAPRGLDRFAIEVAGGVAHRRHRHDHPGPADRHQHHRPGGRGPALHRRRRPLMHDSPADAPGRNRQTSRPSAGRSASSLVVIVLVVARTSSSTSATGRSRGRLRDRAGRQPQAVPRPTRSSRARSSTGPSPSGLLTLFVIAVGLPLYWLIEPGRQDERRRRLQPQVRRAAARACSPPPPSGGFNCAGCHGGIEAGGGVADYTLTDADGEFVDARSTGRRPRSTPCCCATAATRSRYILTYGRPFSPMPAWGIDGGGPLNDQQVQNLIDYLETHPDHARGGPGSRSPRSSTSTRDAEDADGRLTTGLESRGRGAVQPRPRRRLRRRRRTPAPAATPRAGRTPTIETVDGDAARLGPDTSCDGESDPAAELPGTPSAAPSSRSTSSTDGLRATASGYGRTARAAAGCRASARAPPRTPLVLVEVGVEARDPSRPIESAACSTQEQIAADRRVRAERLLMPSRTDVLAAIAWDPEIRNILVVAVGVGVLIGSVYLLARHQHRPPPRLAHRPRRPLRLDDDHGRHLVDLRHRHAGQRPHWQVEEINYARRLPELPSSTSRARRCPSPTSCPTAAGHPRGATRSSSSEILRRARRGAARAPPTSLGELIEVRPRARRGAAARGASSTAGSCWPPSDRQRGDAVATADAFLGADGRGLFETLDRLHGARRLRHRRQGRAAPTTPDRSDRHRRTSCRPILASSRHPTHYAVVQVQAVVPVRRPQPGEAPPLAARSTTTPAGHLA